MYKGINRIFLAVPFTVNNVTFKSGSIRTIIQLSCLPNTYPVRRLITSLLVFPVMENRINRSAVCPASLQRRIFWNFSLTLDATFSRPVYSRGLYTYVHVWDVSSYELRTNSIHCFNVTVRPFSRYKNGTRETMFHRCFRNRRIADVLYIYIYIGLYWIIMKTGYTIPGETSLLEFALFIKFIISHKRRLSHR